MNRLAKMRLVGAGGGAWTMLALLTGTMPVFPAPFDPELLTIIDSYLTQKENCVAARMLAVIKDAGGKVIQTVSIPCMAGNGAAFFQSGAKWNLDPRLIVAIAGQESSFGTDWQACPPSGFNAWSWFWGGSCPNSPFASYADGIETVTKYLRKWVDKGYTSVASLQSHKPPYCASGCGDWTKNVTTFYTQIPTSPAGDPSDLNFPAPVFDFALGFLAVDGNIRGSGNTDNVLDFFDDFDDGSLTAFPTSAFSFAQGLAQTTESGGFLRFRSADGARVGMRFGQTFLEDIATLNFPITKGSGTSEAIASFRADIPAPRQFYAIGTRNSGPTLLESVAISVSLDSNGAPRVRVNDQTGTTLASDPVALPSSGFILFRLFVNDAANQVIVSYSIDNGATYKPANSFKFFLRHGTIFNATSTAHFFAQGGERVGP